ncbi:PTS mannose transporter subunit IIAB [Enterococcus saigonensis]|uniref:PTS mannose transporter subunit IIAB n=1 Tax=Enterococcus saigonensis TaxID=1805431 RepID=A0A679IJ66_9ENTE|nr:PTS sugar transporter subunit IIB [Enterococcus saigonensis]BCA84561.1 PTS mannose transporter subunit IIAB [Enterococcus saigonensis]
MGIENVRIDERLIHGQVANMWTNYLQATRIMVVDNEAAKSDIAKSSLKLATPAGVALSVLSIDKAAANINSGRYNQQRVFLIVKKPETLLDLVKLGVHLPTITVGNMSKKEGTKQLTKSVHVSKTDVEALKEVQKTTEIVVQMVPNETKYTLDELLLKEGAV